jgi:hypothetical protein
LSLAFGVEGAAGDVEREGPGRVDGVDDRDDDNDDVQMRMIMIMQMMVTMTRHPLIWPWQMQCAGAAGGLQALLDSMANAHSVRYLGLRKAIRPQAISACMQQGIHSG